MIRVPPRSTLTDTRFPSTPLFRSPSRARPTRHRPGPRGRPARTHPRHHATTGARPSGSGPQHGYARVASCRRTNRAGGRTMSLLNPATAYRRSTNRPRVPVVLPLVRVDVDKQGWLAVTVDDALVPDLASGEDDRKSVV